MLSKPTLNSLTRRPLRLVPFCKSTLFQFAVLLLGGLPALASACPDLTGFYPGADNNWLEVEQKLGTVHTQCPDNSEFFALVGAAQLNLGHPQEALESLERALLLDPANGAAQIDYAATLFQMGQIFGALELNATILQRADLPENLAEQVRQRQAFWRSFTRRSSVQGSFLAGYANNLNGGPDSGQITLTPSGEPILLTLGSELQPVAGAYANFGLDGSYIQVGPDSQQGFSAGLRGRASSDSSSDLLQAAARYGISSLLGENTLQFNVGLDHLLFGGSALFTGTDTELLYQLRNPGSCKPYFGLAMQHQHYHDQKVLNALESKATFGVNCAGNTGSAGQFSAEVSVLNNLALKSGRLGGDRDGWQANLNWQRPLARGTLQTQLNFTEINDRRGYSPLLKNGVKRWQNRSSALIQYRQPGTVFGKPVTFQVNLYHQQQVSNLELFRTKDTTAEIGFSWQF